MCSLIRGPVNTHRRHRERRRIMSARKTMEVNSYISLNRWILNLVGLYPKNLTKIFAAAFSMLLIVVPQLLQIYHSTELSVILETSSVLLTIVLALLKMIVWSAQKDEIDHLITYMFDDYWNIASVRDQTATCFLKYAAFAKKFTHCYAVLVINSLILFYSLPFVQALISKFKGSINENHKLLFPGMYPNGWTEFPYYEFVLLSQILATSYCGAVVLAIDTLVATAVLHTCGHFKIVQEKLSYLGENLDDIRNQAPDRNSKESFKIFVKLKLAKCIEHHQVVLRFSENVERLFSPIMLCQVLASNMIICLVGVQVSSTLTDQSKVLKYFSYLIMALFQLLLFCFPGDDLINQSLAVSNAVYAANWHNASELVKNDVRFIIARSQKPARITAGKFSVMSLEHFATVLSTSMSYFTVLRSLS